MWRTPKGPDERNSRSSHLQAGNASSSLHNINQIASHTDRCVPARSTATIKLELLPLTDGIITLDSLQIDIKEKGQTYIPEYSLKINAPSSIATGII